MKYALQLAPIITLLVFACDKQVANDDEQSDGTEQGEGEGDGDGDGLDGGVDGEDGDDEQATEDTGGDGDGDCPLGEYIPYGQMPDWSGASGTIDHAVSHSVFGPSTHGVSGQFFTSDFIEESLLCVEIIVESVGVDSCRVWYSQGEGVGNDLPENWYEDLPVDTVTFDVGTGPIALEVWPPSEFMPTSYGAELPSPPNGVPFGGTASLAASFDNLPALAFDLAVPHDLLPLGYAIETATLSSEELTTWTWATPGGSAPLELAVTLGATPFGSGWTEWVKIECEVDDDGAFAFPIEYLELARDRLGSELHAGVTLTRVKTGSVALAGKQLHWRSHVDAWLGVTVVD